MVDYRNTQYRSLDEFKQRADAFRAAKAREGEGAETEAPGPARTASDAPSNRDARAAYDERLHDLEVSSRRRRVLVMVGVELVVAIIVIVAIVVGARLLL